ncbi:MAG: hypothetical protein ACRCST_15500 [Turicibacter sp.]
MERDKHRFYNFLDDLCKRSRFELIVVKTLGSRFEPSFIFVLFDLIYIPYICYKNIFNGKELIIIREFNTIPFFISALFLWPISKRIVLNVNHNFQKALISRVHYWLLILYDALGFRYLCFECEKSPIPFKNTMLTIPFPIEGLGERHFTKTNSDSCQARIGFAGSYRTEKKIEELLIALQPLKAMNYELVLATDNESLLQEYHSKGWMVFNTSDTENYLKSIEYINILVLNYDVKNYYCRHSGVLTDFIAKGKVVIAPNYLIFRRQLLEPCQVGLLFDDLTLLPKLVHSNMGELLCTFDINRKMYINSRRFASVVQQLDEQLSCLKQN